jgi:hypothetical protein
METIKQDWAGRFKLYHQQNPHVYEAFRRFAFELYDAGVRRAGASAIWERMRWEEKVRATREPGLPDMALNNSYRAFYARKLMEDYPQTFGTFFETREQRSLVAA